MPEFEIPAFQSGRLAFRPVFSMGTNEFVRSLYLIVINMAKCFSSTLCGHAPVIALERSSESDTEEKSGGSSSAVSLFLKKKSGRRATKATGRGNVLQVERTSDIRAYYFLPSGAVFNFVFLSFVTEGGRVVREREREM